jgi:manganese transport protein
MNPCNWATDLEGGLRFDYVLVWGILRWKGLVTLFDTFIFLAKPDWGDVVTGLTPHVPAGSVYIIPGIIGATVMPHNLYLHSALVQTCRISRTIDAKRQACKYNLLDSTLVLNAAFFINAVILVLAAAVFYRHGIVVTEIQRLRIVFNRGSLNCYSRTACINRHITVY